MVDGFLVRRWVVVAVAVALSALSVVAGVEVWEEIGRWVVGDGGDEVMVFTFTWGCEVQEIVDGTFKVEVLAWFENHTSPWENVTYEVFKVLFRVYDDDCSSGDSLGLVFDQNQNGVIDLGHEDRPYLFFADNSTAGWVCLGRGGVMGEAEVPRRKSEVCTYNPEEGYTFGPFGGPTEYYASKLGDMPTYIPVYLIYNDGNLYPGVHQVSVHFNIYLDS